MAPKSEAGPSSPPAARTRKPGEVRSRSGCLTCKQRRKKCDEDFRIRHNGALSCSRCADRGIHCEMSSTATPQRSSQQHRPSPYPTPGATPSSNSKELASRSVRGPSTTAAMHPTDLQAVASTSAAPISSSVAPTATTIETGSAPYQPALDANHAWNTSAHFPLQTFQQQQQQEQQQQQQQMSNNVAFQALQNPAAMNQLAWMSQSAAAFNRSAIRYNRPNIWPMTASNGMADPAIATGLPSQAPNAPMQNPTMDMNTLFNFLNSNAATNPAASNTQQWNQGYSNSMDNIMLDDFVSELMSLTGPLVGGENASTAPQTSDNTPVTAPHQSSPLETRPTSHSAQDPSRASPATASTQPRHTTSAASPATSQSKHASVNLTRNSSPSSAAPKSGSAKGATPARTSNRYRKLLDSDAIESLLSKYSPIYERFWHATLMLLSNKKRQAAVDYLMTVVRSNKACRASVVVVCLAYHELVQRVRKGAQKSGNTVKPPPQNWTSVATDAVNRSSMGSDAGRQAKASKTAQDGPSRTGVDAFSHDADDDAERRSSRSHSGVADDSIDEDMRPSRAVDREEDQDEEGDVEPEEEISTIEHRRSSEKPYTSTSAKVSSERYGPTSFSRRSEPAAQPSPRPPTRSLTGKLSTVEDNIQEMDDPSRDAFKGQQVEKHTVELWLDIAQAELQRSRDELALDQELCAIINIRWACLCFAGAERARQLTEELGMVMQREGIDMDHAREEEKKGSFVSVMLLTAVYTDVLDTVSDRGKRSHVVLRDANTRPRAQLSRLRRASSMADGESDSEPFFGRISLVSLELLTCFKLISDLAADVWGPISSSVAHPTRPSEEEVAERSREVERKVMSLPPWSDPNTSSSLRVRAFALQEIWRQTARLYLLQAVHRRGPLHPELQNILHEIIRLAKMMKIQSFSPTAPIFTSTHGPNRTSSMLASRSAPPNYIGGLSSADDTSDIRDANHPDPFINATIGMEDFHDPSSASAISPPADDDDESGPLPFQMWLDVASWEMCTVWFLCSTVALTRQDRQFCIHHLESLGLERANRDNIQVIRDYWAKQDATGHTLDWFDFVKNTGRSVIFAF